MGQKTDMNKAVGLIKEIFYPDTIKCIVCDCELPESNRYCICDHCRKSVITEFCHCCGKEVAAGNTVCDRCKHDKFDFTAARACFVYRDGAAILVRRLKYRDARYLAPYMAQFMFDVLSTVDWKIDAVTFVPMYWLDHVSRVYNQSQLLAQALSKLIDKPTVKTLRKIRRNGHMAKLGREERHKRLIDSFDLTGGVDIKGKNILLVDDVLTTGFTASECAHTLKKGKCANVYVLTFATGENKPMTY